MEWMGLLAGAGVGLAIVGVLSTLTLICQLNAAAIRGDAIKVDFTIQYVIVLVGSILAGAAL